MPMPQELKNQLRNTSTDNLLEMATFCCDQLMVRAGAGMLRIDPKAPDAPDMSICLGRGQFREPMRIAYQAVKDALEIKEDATIRIEKGHVYIETRTDEEKPKT